MHGALGEDIGFLQNADRPVAVCSQAKTRLPPPAPLPEKEGAARIMEPRRNVVCLVGSPARGEAEHRLGSFMSNTPG